MKLKWDNNGMKTPQARAQGLGSAKEGTSHWLHQRFTAVLNLPLLLWLVYSLKTMNVGDYKSFEIWLSVPMHTILMLLFVFSVFYHAVLGAQVIVEDYVHHEGLKITKLIFQRALFLFMAFSCVYSIFKVALGG